MEQPLYCDYEPRRFLSIGRLPYGLPETLRHRVKPGCRLLVPFGARKNRGIGSCRCHNDPPEGAVREALRLLDAEPVISESMLALGQWISDYYCAPLGEVLRTIAPAGGEIRQGKTYSLNVCGRARCANSA